MSYLGGSGGAIALQDVRALEGGVGGTGNSGYPPIALGGAASFPSETPRSCLCPSAGRPADVLKVVISLMEGAA